MKKELEVIVKNNGQPNTANPVKVEVKDFPDPETNTKLYRHEFVFESYVEEEIKQPVAYLVIINNIKTPIGLEDANWFMNVVNILGNAQGAVGLPFNVTGFATMPIGSSSFHFTASGTKFENSEGNIITETVTLI